jgi:glyoxylate reductase
MRKRLLFTSKLPGNDFEELCKDQRFETVVLEKNDNEKLISKVESFDPHAIISLLSDKINSDLISKAPSLEVVSNYAVGYNNIDIDFCSSKGIYVTNTPGVLTDATADIAFMLILMASRRAVEAERFTRKGLFTGWEPELFAGLSLQNKTLGIAGLGRIGYATAKRAHAFGMNIIYFNRNRIDVSKESEIGAEKVSFDDLLRKSDVISLHLPFTPEVRHLIGEKEFKMMKKNAILINTARGPLIDEKSLAKALSENTIFGAGLDVYEFEPQIEETLKTLENIVLLPHIGSATKETRSKMAEMVIKDAVTVLTGSKPFNQVNLK